MWDKTIFLKNIDYLVLKKCNGINQVFNNKINDRDATTKWKTTENRPSVKALLKISKVFDVSVDWLLMGKEQQNNNYNFECDETTMDLCRTVKELIESKSHWGYSLEANIKSFKAGHELEKDVRELKKANAAESLVSRKKHTTKSRAM